MYIILGSKATRARRGAERGSKREREIHRGEEGGTSESQKRAATK